MRKSRFRESQIVGILKEGSQEYTLNKPPSCPTNRGHLRERGGSPAKPGFHSQMLMRVGSMIYIR